MERKGNLMTYRPDIKVFDATIRDGGLVNDFRFSDEFVKALYLADLRAGVDYMEMGYLADTDVFKTSDFGDWKFCKEESLRRVERITGRPLTFYKADMRDAAAMHRLFSEQEIDAVVHFAGLKAVGESVEKPLEYYGNNIAGTVTLCESMRAHGSDVVVGSKRHPESNVQYPWHRRLASAVYFGLVRLFIGLPITDTQTGMKLFKRRLLGEALDRMLVKTYAFDLELLSIAYGRGAKISEAPVEIRFGGKFGALKPRTVRDMTMDTLAVFYRLRLLHYYAKVEVPPPLEKLPLVSVVIACPGPSWMLDECLTALAAQTYRNFEVIVLPDGEVKGERGKVKGDARGDDDSHSAFHLSTIPTGKVRPAEKRNIGIAEAKGEIVAFIDDDAYPDAHWLENAVKYFSEPSIGGVGGPGVTPPGDGFLAQAGGRVYANIFVSGNYRYRYVGGRVRLDVDDYPSCNLLVRTDLLRKIGGYRTDFWPGEDTLLCDAIVLGEHKRIVYDPWAIVYHHRRRLFGPHLRQLGRYGFHRGYFVKRFPATSCRASYFVPSLFVLGVLLGCATFALPPHMSLVCTMKQ